MKPMPETRRALLTLAAGAAMLCAAAAAHARIVVDMTRGTVEPLPIAVPVFHDPRPAGPHHGRLIADVVSADLARSGLFRPIDRRAFIQGAASLAVQPRFGDWRQINAQALVSGVVKRRPDGQLRVEVRLWDVFGGAQMTGVAYTAAPAKWRSAWMTGNSG